MLGAHVLSRQLRAGPRMSNRLLTGVSACVFDAYGTLFDFASAARACKDVLGDAVERVSALWRDKQLQYTWLRAAQGRHADFWQVTGDALDFTLETLGLDRPGLRDRLMTLYLTLETFPEVPDVLDSALCSMPYCPSSKSGSSSRTRASIN